MPLHDEFDEFEQVSEFDEEFHDSDDASSADLLPCPSCGQMVFDDTDKCPYCGDWIMPIAAAGRSGLWIRIVGALVVLALLAAIGRLLL